MRRLKVVGLCGGNGVSLYPFLNQDKFEVVGNIEPRAVFHSPGEKQWKANFGNIPMVKDLETWASKYVKADIIVSHPDCGHSSIMTYNKMKSYGDPRENASVQMFFKGILELKPKMWLMENLENMLRVITVEDIEKVFPNYDIYSYVGSVMMWGNSQKCRKRLVLVGIKKKYSGMIGMPGLYSVSKPRKNYQINGDIANLQSLPEIGHHREPLSKEVCLWIGDDKVTLGKARRMWRTEFKDRYTWPGHYKAHIQPAVYRQVKKAYPRTVRKGDRQFNWLGRHLSAREMARIQGIPDKFILFYHESKPIYWVNKGRATVAKCPPMEIFTWFKEVIEKDYSILINKVLK